MDEEEEETSFGYEHFGECAGCDFFESVDDQGLCSSCAEKLERDLIRQRDWDYTLAGFAAPQEKREELRAAVIAKYGRDLELIADKNAGNAEESKKRRWRAKPR